MTLLVCGMNHHTAPVAMRERLAISQDIIEKALKTMQDEAIVEEAAFLFTCNRCELYAYSENPEGVFTWLSRWHGISVEELKSYSYLYTGEAMLKHAMSVASGLDSMMLGEPQIFGQMKEAVRTAQDINLLGRKLNPVFQQVFNTAKRIRSQTDITKNAVSVAFAGVSLAKCIFTNLSSLQVLLVGAGDTVLRSAQHFYEAGVRDIICANRTLERAGEVADKFAGRAIAFSEIPEVLPNIDIVLSATASTLPILGKGLIERCVRQRRSQRPMFIVDLAVPRDVEPEVSDISGVYLYNIDDLQQIATEGLNKRKQAATQADKIIDIEAKNVYQKLNQGDFTATIRDFRDKVELLREQELAEALALLDKGHSAEQAMNKLARSLTKKLMHIPSVRLRKAGHNNDKATLQAAKQLFDIED